MPSLKVSEIPITQAPSSDPTGIQKGQPMAAATLPPAQQKTVIFPHDLGAGSYVRKTRDENEADYYFINFGIVSPKGAKELNIGTASQVVDRRGKKIDQWRSRDVTVNDLSPLLRNAYTPRTDTNIVLYMPDEIKATYASDIVNVDQGLMANYINNDAMSGMGSSMNFIKGNIDALFKAGIAGVIGVTDPAEAFAQYNAKNAQAVNPSTEQLFKNIKPRQFNYSFKLVPRNEAEGKTIQSIIKLFKYHMHPAITSVDRVEFQFPSLFVITYYKSANVYEELHKISACYLESFNVDYTGVGQFQAFRDGQPVQINLDLQFKETVIQTKDSIGKGY